VAAGAWRGRAVRVLARLWLAKLTAAHHAGRLNFFAERTAPAGPRAVKDRFAP
jgi:hypothetical protein